MDSPGEILSLCRLCLVKDQVNIPIFEEQGDIRQIFLKISSCLPVTITRHDQLPKKICDACSNKLDLLYEFWNSSASAEKTLLSWLGQAGVKDAGEKISAVAQQIAKPAETLVKEESEALDESQLINEANVINETNLTNESRDSFEEHSLDEDTKDEAEAPPPKRARRTAAVKAQINITPESDEDDDEDYDAGDAMTKMEDESDESESELKDDPSYSEVPGTSADDQAGPSGVGKDGVEAPSSEAIEHEFIEFEGNSDEEAIEQYQCGICSEIFSTKIDFIEQHLHTYAKKLTCCKCLQTFSNSDDMCDHHEIHKDDDNFKVLYEAEATEGEELILMNEGEHFMEVQQADEADLVYILDETDGSCENEVVIQNEVLQVQSNRRTRQSSIKTGQMINVEHGYVLSADSGEAVAATPRRSYSFYKPRANPLPKRHELPDFSATNYIVMAPNDDLDATHYKCQRCEQLFINKFGFFRHIEKGKCFVNNCDVCSAQFSSNRTFYDHYLVAHRDRAICNFCFRTFMYEKNVKEHMLRHLDQFRHRCEACSKGFYTVREYRNHYKNRHMGIRYTCEVCSRSFADEYYFKKHKDTHQLASSETSFQNL